jgi:hypothetical protein
LATPTRPTQGRRRKTSAMHTHMHCHQFDHHCHSSRLSQELLCGVRPFPFPFPFPFPTNANFEGSCNNCQEARECEKHEHKSRYVHGCERILMMPRRVTKRIRKIYEKSSRRLNLSELPTLCRKFRWTATSDTGPQLPTIREVLTRNSKLKFTLRNLAESKV